MTSSFNRKPIDQRAEFAHLFDSNRLVVGGISVDDLLERTGSGPFYAYDSSRVSQVVDRVKGALPTQIELHYAVKANPMPALISHMAQHVDGMDVASSRELELVTSAKVDPSRVSFAGPGKSDRDLHAGVDAGVMMVIESLTEARRLAGIANEHDTTIRCALRVNPDFTIKGAGMAMGGGAQQFGIDAEKVPDAIQAMSDMPLDICGFHIFGGSQNLNTESLSEAHRATLSLIERLAPNLKGDLSWVNIGGGLGVPYFDHELPLNIELLGEALSQTLAAHRDLLGSAAVVMELGRFLIADSGAYVCSVIDKKVSRGTTFLITNGGLHHHLAATGNFGQVVRRNYPVVLANRLISDEMEKVSVVGPLCTPLDLLARDITLPRAEVGDSIAVLMSGAYGFSASPRGFLSHPEPEEFLL